MRVLSCDPGPHTGVAVLNIEEVGQGFRAWEETPESFYAVCEGWVRWADVVVCESFKITGARAKEANETIEMIGVLRYLCARRGVELVEQSPADAKIFAPGSQKLKALGWWVRGSDHAQSASRHLLLYTARNRLVDLSRLVS